MITIIKNKKFPVPVCISQRRLKEPLSFRNENHFIRKWDELNQTKQNGIDVCSHRNIKKELELGYSLIQNVVFSKGR